MIETWYKNTIESATVVPPDSVWENIQDSLDIDMVWDRIDAHLSAPEPSHAPKRTWYYAAASLVLFLVTSIVFLITNHTDEPMKAAENDRSSLLTPLQSPLSEKISEQEKKQYRGALKNSSDVSNASHRADTVKTVEIRSNANRRVGAVVEGMQSNSHISSKANPSFRKHSVSGMNRVSADAGISARDDHSSLKGNTVVDQGGNSVQDSPSSSYGVETGSDDLSFITEREMVQRAHERLSQLKSRGWRYELLGLQLVYNPIGLSRGLESNQMPHGFFVGLNLSFTNVWLLNNETISGLDKSTMHTTVASYRYSSGILVGYSFSDYLGMQAECDLISKYGQAYKEYYHGKYVTKSIDLDYITYKVILKNKHPFVFRNRYAVSNNLLFGLSYGQLLNAKEQIAGESSPSTPSYNSSNFSAILGAELELKHTNKSSSTLGFRLNMGLNDVSGSDESKTRNFSLELNYAYKFYLSK